MEKKYSNFGIWSFITGTAAVIQIFTFFIVCCIIEASGVGDKPVADLFAVLFILGCLFLGLLAIALGIAGLLQKDREKVSSMLGVIFGASSTVTIVILLIAVSVS